MRTRAWGLCVAALAIAVGCVIRTEHKIDAHIRVDIRHIEEQAANVLDFIEGETDTLQIQPAPAEPNTSWRRVLERFAPIQSAYAQELKADSARIREIAERLRARNSQVDAIKKKGYAGEDNRGYVALRNAPEDANEKNEVQRLIAEENADRKELYREIAALNRSDGVTLSQVERVYAQARLERGKEGDLFQLPPAGPDFDKFKASPLGKKLGDKAQPDAWVTL